jgi:lipoprotein signal peptidase
MTIATTRWGAGVEQSIGIALMLFTLGDVFLTVLYARMGTSLIARWVCLTGWRLFRRLSRTRGERGQVLMTTCGPFLLVLIVVLWATLLTLGAALVIHPALGNAVRQSQGETGTDFVNALYASGTSLALVGGSSFSPHSDGFRLFYLANSLIGTCVVSLTLTYVMQIYSALQRRNALGLSFEHMTAGTGEAAEFLAGLTPRGELSGAYSLISNLANEMTQVKEAHHFYPMLFYFRFREPYYAVSRFCLIALDAMSLLSTALDDEHCGWLKDSAAVAHLSRSALVLVTALERTFPKALDSAASRNMVERTDNARSRYFAALDRLRLARIPVTVDAEEGARRYAERRNEWYPHIARLAPAMGYAAEEIDPGIAASEHPRARGTQTATH